MTDEQLAEWDLTLADYRAIRESARDNAAQADDFGCNATVLAELVAEELDHDEWLDDETHPLWDVVIDVCDEYDSALWRDAEEDD